MSDESPPDRPGRRRWAWSTPGVAKLLRDVVFPAMGAFGMLTDRPLTPLAAGAYLAMMGLPVGGWADRLRERRTPPPGERPERQGLRQ